MKSVFEKPVYRFRNIGVRVSPDELSNLHKLSEITHLSMSEIIRLSVNEFATKQQGKEVF